MSKDVLIDALRQKAVKLRMLREEAQALEAELKDALDVFHQVLEGPQPQAPPRLTEGGSTWWAYQVLAKANQPMDIGAIMAEIQRQGGHVNKATLLSNLCRYVANKHYFTRPKAGVYALVQEAQTRAA